LDSLLSRRATAGRQLKCRVKLGTETEFANDIQLTEGPRL